MFRRRRRNEEADQSVEELDDLAELDEDEPADELEDDEALRRPLPPAPRPDGPWDESELDDPHEGRIDLGGLLVPATEGMELRVEVANDLIIAATVILEDSAVQVQAFAAPRSEGIWHEIRAEIASGITQQGGVVDELDGGLGWELRAQVPVQLPDGTQGAQLVRFVGCDGPRWFLRGVISGRAAVDPDTGAELERIFRDTVVVRGAEPMAPRDPILLRLPDNAQIDPASGVAPGGDDAGEQGRNQYGGDLNPFQRGPEITEVR
ncbi:DUF3710 domain-containing protein [Yinghuangia seranimata]|uniref:DUF3710 domain-containing protein n=1 Tax=Yinghuangia seranimata TaxID=408067 RepID=UPI00248AD1A9|nr:DUF3710 domain-containing protein [Yinghuangia seranimata]MDI2128716.1 DUF3710 domain-containing protein [Yinghuangia seranimata]